MKAPRIRTLIVDDEADARELLRLQLERTRRFEIVGEAATSSEAVEQSDTCPDVIILDELLGEESGVECIPDMLTRAPGALIIIYTATTGTATRQRAAELGAKAVVGKTDSVDMLIGVIDRLLDAGSKPAAKVTARSEEFTADMRALLHEDTQERPQRKVRDHGVRPLVVVAAIVALPVLAVAVWVIAALLGLTR